MNEYAILMKLLTRTGTPMGAGVEDMLDSLGLPEDVGRHVLFKRLGALHNKLLPLGLVIKHNPVSHVFYVDTSSQTDSVVEDSILPDRLAATLLIVITLAYQEGGIVSIERIRKFRKKSRRGVLTDLRELAEMDYVVLDTKANEVRPGDRVAFEIDYERFFRKLTGNDTQ